MPTCQESRLERSGAPDLLLRRWACEGARGRSLLIHGFGEHGGRYGHVADALVGAGLEVGAVDLRGHGGSSGTRAFVERFDDYLDDVDAALVRLRSESGDLPLFLVGHSMGGLVAALWVLEQRALADGLVLSSPGFAFALRVPAWKAVAGRICSRIAPRLALPSGLDRGLLSHDPEVARALERDPHSQTATTARWYTEALAAQVRAGELAAGLEVPLLCQVAGADALVDPEAARRFYDSATSSEREWIRYDELYHEIYNELERDRVLADLTAWIETRLEASSA
ncbi:MAG: alpha/beta hydrolase [Planctomycetota bacterium]|jgi:alpha-beta hydrolase superfamily lysophospholipase|nr:alpha/beta hydrolase [Planctomycetota bacterium]MDP6761459.1 alpha/beta hydrolase [Planctomycetota bacterium]MDP6988089.1 alpha/beta hydrolase [Planctomycetota bacterium]